MYRKLSDLEKVLQSSNEKKRISLAVSQDEHSLGAIQRAVNAGIMQPVFVGDEKKTKEIITKHDYSFPDAEFINIEDSRIAISTAVDLVNKKQADILMKGKSSTKDFLQGVLNKENGLSTNKILSHIAVFEIPTYHKLLALSDAAMIIAPTLKEKVGIINNSVNFLHKIGIEMPKVAVLGAVEVVNEAMPATTDAAILTQMNQRGQISGCIIDGPLAIDNAINKESAIYKGIESDIAGDPDLLIAPQIESGNILYKTLIFLAKAKVGSILLGAKSPIVLSSRSDSDESKYYSILMSCFFT